MTILKELHGHHNNKDENINNLEEEWHLVTAQFQMKGTISVPLFIIPFSHWFYCSSIT
jgi:hypothetical protein